jgi:gliding motility-associated-like protein
VYDFSDGSTYATTDTVTTHTYTSPGSYVPRIVLQSNTGCQSYSTGTDVIKVDGVYPGFTYLPYPACGSDTIHFTDTSHAAFSTITSTEWFFHDGQISTLSNPEHYYTPGSFSVILTEITSTGCYDTVNTTLTIFNIPQITARPDTTVCLGDSAMLYASGGTSYIWGPPTNLSCTSCPSPYANPATQTAYFVTGTDANGCTNTDTTIVFLKTKVAGSADSIGQICQHDTLQLHASADDNNAVYTWLPPDGLSDSHSSNPFASPSGTTDYMLIISEGKCIPDTLFSNIIVHPVPSISAGPDQTIIAGNSTTIYTTAANVISYLWTPDSALSCDTCADPDADPKHSIRYRVTATSDFGCVDSSSVLIKIICDHSQVYIPNTFTPNGDGANDHFYPHGKGLQIIKSFRIYDRWGEMVFEKQNFNLNEIDKSWDGTYNGQKLTPDVYVYVVDAICDTGDPITWTGDVALIR